jgi:trigger factor
LKQVQEKVLPEETDEWAEEASEFSTVAELREDIKKRLSQYRRALAVEALRHGAMEALIGLVKEGPPAALVAAETRRLAEGLGRRLDSQGVPLQRYLDTLGRTLDDVVAEMQAQAVASVKIDLALRAVAEDLGIEPSEAEMDQYLERMAKRAGATLEQVRAEIERRGQRSAVRSELKKSKAFDWLVEHAEVTDEEGNPVDRALLSTEEGGDVLAEVAAPGLAPGFSPETADVEAEGGASVQASSLTSQALAEEVARRGGQAQ